DVIDGDAAGVFNRTVEHRHVELLLLVLDAVAAGTGGRVHRNHPAVLRHVLGELGGTDAVGGVDDVLLVGGDQRAQHESLGDAIGHRGVGRIGRAAGRGGVE